MPNRLIKESCRSSKNLDQLTDFEERLFWRLITTADDFGRFLACPELVRAACFPYRKLSLSTITNGLTGIARHHLIDLYRVGSREYGVFLTWELHQGKPRSLKSKYPAPLDNFKQADVITYLPVHTDASCSVQPCSGPNTNTDTDTDTNTDTDPKKRGESERRGKRAIAEEDAPTDKHRALAKELGVDIGPEWGKFKNYCKAHDKRYADFEAAFRNWIARAGERHGGRHVF